MVVYTVKEDLYFKYKEEGYLECRQEEHVYNAGIDQGLDYQPSKLKIWVRIPLPVAHLVELVDTIDSNSVPSLWGIGSTPMVSKAYITKRKGS